MIEIEIANFRVTSSKLQLVLVEIYIKPFVLAARAAFRSAVWHSQTDNLLSNPLWLRHSRAARGAREEKESRR
jgi:hypothetical protein